MRKNWDFLHEETEFLGRFLVAANLVGNQNFYPAFLPPESSCRSSRPLQLCRNAGYIVASLQEDNIIPWTANP